MTTLQFEAEPYPLAFDPASTALLLVDLQRDFVEPGGFADVVGEDISLVQAVIEPCRRLLECARQAGIAVVFVHQGYQPDLSDCPPARLAKFRGKQGIGDVGPLGRMMIRGEKGFEILPQLQPRPGETVVEKSGFGAFHDTDLHSRLTYAGIRTLIVCGVATDVCVEATFREATDRGFNCIVPADCTGSYYPEFKRNSLALAVSQNVIHAWVSDSERILRALEQGKAPAAVAAGR